jgi:hypothetical protein
LNSHDFHGSQPTWTNPQQNDFPPGACRTGRQLWSLSQDLIKRRARRDVGKAGIFCNAQELAIDLPPASWQTERVRGVRGTIQEPLHMTMQAHLSELERKHRALEDEIADAMTHPSTDDLKIAELKRKKLLVKDEIVRLRVGDQPSLH